MFKNRRVRILATGGLLLAVGVGLFFTARAYARDRARIVLADLRRLDGAADQYSIEHGLTGYEMASWEDLKQYLYPSSRLYRNGGRDPLGHPYHFGPSDEGFTWVDERTLAALSWAVDPKAFLFNQSPPASNPGVIRPPEIIAAARRGDVQRVRELLKHGANIDQTDMFKRTALSWAAQFGYTEVARVICSAHPHPAQAINTPGLWLDYTPMGHAQRRGHPDVVALFLDHGAALAPDELRLGGRRDTEVLRLLLARGMSPDVHYRGDTFLAEAARYGNIGSVHLLIGAGADLNAREWDGKTALQRAGENFHADVAELLRAAGAKE